MRYKFPTRGEARKAEQEYLSRGGRGTVFTSPWGGATDSWVAKVFTPRGGFRGYLSPGGVYTPARSEA